MKLVWRRTKWIRGGSSWGVPWVVWTDGVFGWTETSPPDWIKRLWHYVNEYPYPYPDR